MASASWANWKTTAAPWTVGVEEEVMLLEVDGSPAWRSEDVLRILPEELVEHARGETHGLALELATQPHARVSDAAAELRSMRAGLAGVVRSLGLRAAVAGMHPLVTADEVEVSPGARYQFLHQSLRELARREPTFALHVHVAVPDAELAVRALNGMRAHIPVLLALSANSPFTRGRDSGLASARTPVFQAFPRTGIPREFSSYAEYVDAIDILIRCGAIPEPTFIWWDVRLQPKLGTLEVRVMDAQTRIRDTAALVALVQCLVRCEALGTCAEPELAHAPEVLDENRFLAARDGIHAQLLDPHRDRCVPASGRLATLVDACWPHARELGCERELQLLAHLAGDPGATRQRAIATEPAGLRGLLHTLQAEFSPPRPQLALAA
ncbi:YbdK family carboxylate-amine ligase [Solirubrobacter phytolaccae]|uniref:Putative glutamate--cysteine ligase 2 n=1 Tax=Solirubrobacter phytolaccae TaxID=1404360 RepID=A0A9X3S8R9_9ACTN|nr:YbdK family carboxylate-amine ligase [Solirubrobacter phytolaccae]MDA0180651.1 YbdK family carboxylate-amine ligase [Solirubrobacter phytolaccae]